MGLFTWTKITMLRNRNETELQEAETESNLKPGLKSTKLRQKVKGDIFS